jgi:hypothetical protein
MDHIKIKGMTAIFIAFCMILLLSLVIATPPFQTSDVAEKSILIELPVIETQKLNQNFTYHVHLHNSTDGQVISNSLIKYCSIHIYDPLNGNHLIEANMSKYDALDWQYLVLGGNFTEVNRQYAGYVYCQVNNSVENRGGYFEWAFTVTNEGVEFLTQEALANLGFLAFFLIILVLFINYTNNVNLESAYSRILKLYGNKNYIKLVLASLWFNIISNRFVCYYLIGIPIMIILTNLSYMANIEVISGLMIVLLSIYFLMSILVAIYFFSYIQEWTMNLLEDLKNIGWGIQ